MLTTVGFSASVVVVVVSVVVVVVGRRLGRRRASCCRPSRSRRSRSPRAGTQHASMSFFTVLLHRSMPPREAAQGQRDGRRAGGPRPRPESRRRSRPASAESGRRDASRGSNAARAAVVRRRRAHDGEQPARERPGDERDGNLQREPDEERGRRDEDRHAAAVDEPLEVLLERRTSRARRAGTPGPAARRAAVPSPASTSPASASRSSTCGACARYAWNGSVGVDVSR